MSIFSPYPLYSRGDDVTPRCADCGHVEVEHRDGRFRTGKYSTEWRPGSCKEYDCRCKRFAAIGVLDRAVRKETG